MNDSWMNYFPDPFTPLGMIIYSILVYILVLIHHKIKNRTIEKYVSKNLSESMKRSQ